MTVLTDRTMPQTITLLRVQRGHCTAGNHSLCSGVGCNWARGPLGLLFVRALVTPTSPRHVRPAVCPSRPFGGPYHAFGLRIPKGCSARTRRDNRVGVGARRHVSLITGFGRYVSGVYWRVRFQSAAPTRLGGRYRSGYGRLDGIDDGSPLEQLTCCWPLTRR
jgi:hypothetical protein